MTVSQPQLCREHVFRSWKEKEKSNCLQLGCANCSGSGVIGLACELLVVYADNSKYFSQVLIYG